MGQHVADAAPRDCQGVGRHRAAAAKLDREGQAVAGHGKADKRRRRGRGPGRHQDMGGAEGTHRRLGARRRLGILRSTHHADGHYLQRAATGV